MESHPVPQNVTSFEFHLIGDMTLKQFGYLGGGVGIAYLVFIIIGSSFPYIAWPIIFVSAGAGVALAFLPIQEQPLDHWLGAFIAAIFKPTQLKFKSDKIQPDSYEFENRLILYLNYLENPVIEVPPVPQVQPQPVPKPTFSDTPIQAQPAVSTPVINPQPTISQPRPAPQPPVNQPVTPPKPAEITKPQVAQVTQPQTTTQPPIKPETLPTPEELKYTVDLAKRAQTIQTQILQTEQQLNQIKINAAQPGSDSKTFLAQFGTLITQLQGLNQQAGDISKQLAVLSKSSLQNQNIVTKAKSIPTLSLTQTPNIINGIVTDANGDYLEDSIVVAHDKQNLPVRALKTNKLGQFIAATPLPEGTYTINVEKDDLFFDTVEINLKGEVLNPIMISARKAGLG